MIQLSRGCFKTAANIPAWGDIRKLSSAAKPSSSAPPHHDLSTFLTYARSRPLSPTSTTYVGTFYEYLCLSTLRQLSFTLTHTGGRFDRGIDLLGHWHLPSLPNDPLRVLVQCKASRAKCTPSLIRELEGMYAGAPAGWRGAQTVAVLCTKREATKGVREAVRGSRVPVMWVMIEDLGGDGGRVRQVLWNSRVNELGAEGMGVGMRYLPAGEKGGEVEKEAILTWKGEAWELSHGKEQAKGRAILK